MSAKNYTQNILKELLNNSHYIEDQQLLDLIDLIENANHIFLAGAGRSGVAITGFANRLMHLGFSVSLIGDLTSPHSQEGDLLIIGSGSGETESLVSLAQKAKRNGINLGLITMDRMSSIANLANVTLVLPGVSPKLKNQGLEITSIQPMGSAFEQLAFLTYDGIILELMDRSGETSESMFGRHADLE